MKHKGFGKYVCMLVFGLALFSVTLVSTVFAEESGSTRFSVEILPSLSVSVSDVSIAAGNNLTTGTSTITIGSNNQTGFTTTITTNATSTESYATDLRHTTIDAVIPTLTSNTAKVDFPTNRWGISFDDATYSPIPAADQTGLTPVSLSADAPASITSNIYVGVKIDETVASGTYQNSLLVTVLSNFVPEPQLECNPSATNISNAVCMQDMNENVKDSMVIEQQYQLIDSRDNKKYWIAKLADGKVWMTQNLDLDLSTRVALTNNDTDLNTVTSWQPSDSTDTRTSQTASCSNTEPCSYDPGNKYYYVGGSGNDITYNSIESCVAAGHATSECEHYHAGNYYDWTAAIASNNSSAIHTMHEVAPNSICPKGWRLWRANQNESSPGEMGNLIFEYGLISTPTTTSEAWRRWMSPDNRIAFQSAPIYMVRAGCASREWFGTAWDIDVMGQEGYYWSSTAYSNIYGYEAFFDSSGVYPQSVEDLLITREWAFSVRCVAR